MKILLFSLLTLILFIGCEKETERPANAFEPVKGEWVRKLVINVYYNSSDAVEYSNKEVGIINYTITEGNITTLYRDAGNQSLHYTYTTSESNGKRFLTVTNGRGTDTYELVSVTEQHMVWQVEKTDFVYYIGTDWRKAAKYVRTIEFEK